MSNYGYQAKLKELYNRVVDLYRGGNQDPSTYFGSDEKVFLATIGARGQEIFDFVDDLERYGEPDYETFQIVMGVRRDFFLEVQNGVANNSDIEESSLPAKKDEVRGIAWLPRLIPKARARLRGELPDSLMYCCGGDRKFLQTHDIHPADFLRATWAFMDDDDKLITWVESRSKARAEVV